MKNVKFRNLQLIFSSQRYVEIGIIAEENWVEGDFGFKCEFCR